MYTNRFINVLSAAPSGGSFSVTLQSLNASANSTLTLSCTGITAGLGADAIALMAREQFATQLTQYGATYNGVPVFSYQAPLATYRVLRTDHVICFFSECVFELTLDSNDTGAQIEAAHDPYLITLTEFEMLAGINGVGAGLTDEQMIFLISVVSGLICDNLNNLIVVAGYVQSYVGYWQRSFFLSLGLPTQSWDLPRVVLPSWFFQWWITLLPYLTWAQNPNTGELSYLPAQDIVNYLEPGQKGNAIKISYTAGNAQIPKSVTWAMVALLQGMIQNSANVKSIKTGSFAVTLRDKSLLESSLDSLSFLQL